MSLVEKALQKLRAAGAPAAEQQRAACGVSAASATAAVPSAPAPVRTLALAHDFDAASPPIVIDTKALAESRVLPPESEAHRAAGEYRAIKRRVLASAFGSAAAEVGAPSRLVAVTSALAGDGKTHTTVNLAFSLARERDFEVVVVDADAAKSRFSELMGVAGERGLLDVLDRPEVDIRPVLRRTNIPGLSIVPAGRRSEVATELLASRHMADACAQLLALLPRAVILLDSPPLLLTTEAQVLADLAGQVLLVVRASETPRQAVADAVKKVAARERVHLVLNMAQADPFASYYGGYGNYGSYGN